MNRFAKRPHRRALILMTGLVLSAFLWTPTAVVVSPANAARSALEEGKAFEAKKEFAKAAEAYERAIAESPKAPEPRYRLAGALRALDRRPEAVDSLNQALAIKPAYGEALVLLGQIQEERELWTDAIDAYLKAQDAGVKTADLQSRLGNAYRHTREYDKAVAVYQKATALDPSSVAIRYELANTLAEMDRGDDALAEYEDPRQGPQLLHGSFPEGTRVQAPRQNGARRDGIHRGVDGESRDGLGLFRAGPGLRPDG
jgi:tetratricopeptide (TPR) repeat protein